MDIWPSHIYLGLSKASWKHNVVKNVFVCSSIKNLNLFQHDIAHMHNAKSLKACFAKFGVKAPKYPAQSPKLNLNKELWNDLESRLHPRPHYLTSMPDLTNALVAKWPQIPTPML